MRYCLVLLSLLLSFNLNAYESGGNGTTSVKAVDGNVTEVMDRLEALLKEKDITIFNRINHAASAKEKADIDFHPAELLIFGNPKIGAPLMQCAPSIAIDLPMKILVWQDSERNVWLTYNSINYLKGRHQVRDCDAILEKMSKALAGFAQAAAGTVQ